jgi:glycosyltransferase involved in cell wall biosynthesis
LGQLLFHLSVIRYILRRWRQVDIVFFTQLSGLWLLFPLRLIRFLTLSKRPLLVMDTRDLDDPVPGNFRIQLRIWLHQIVFAMADILADGQTAITPRMAELVKIPDDQLLGIWPSGVDPDAFTSALEKRCWPVDSEPVHLMYLGILLDNRHPAELCRAVERANAAGMNIQLSLVGDGPDRAALEPFVQTTSGRVRIVPPVPHDQIPNVLAQAHVGVTSLPDPDDIIYQASSPIKLFEYMAAGLPILATRNVCHTNVVGDGEFAFWADKTDEQALFEAVKIGWDRRAELAKLGHQAQHAVHGWTWKAAARKLSIALDKGLQRSA